MTKEQFITSAESAEDQDGFDIFAETETDEKEDIADAFDVSPEEIAVYRVRGWQPVFAEV